MFFALDSSRGRGRNKFRKVKNFVETLSSKLHLGASQTRVGFLQYDNLDSTKNSIVVPRNESAEEMLWRIQNMKYRKGKGSYLGKALKTINKKVG